jgi:3-oxoacyl-[acyl-carrier-protein] synthase-3
VKAYITRITDYLPTGVEENEQGRLSKKTGILKRHICAENEIASDLAIKAVQKLLYNGVDKTKIEFLILCTQSPDYFLPTTACILQDKLELNKTCGALDVNLGCSGYVYCLSLAKGLIETKQVKNVLLVTSETYSKYISPEDKSVKPLFGDAATATFIEGYETDKDGLSGFVFGTDGSGYKNLIVPVGGMKERFLNTKVCSTTDYHGNKRTNSNLFMDGAAISDFALEVVPETLRKILEKCSCQKDDIDYYVFHQANKFMLEFLKEKCGIQSNNYWNDCKEYGNTVSNSIPLALLDLRRFNKEKRLDKTVLIGFGVGLSWCGCMVNLSKFIVVGDK